MTTNPPTPPVPPWVTARRSMDIPPCGCCGGRRDVVLTGPVFVCGPCDLGTPRK